jgi:thioredoxin reductase
VDVLVVGGGPAGLAAARALARAGVGRVEVLEREAEAGGIPRHSDHVGFGLRDLHRALRGPAYARRLVDGAVAAGADIRTHASATGWAGSQSLEVTSPDGLELIHARAVLLATGARERPRPARLVPGDRPAGVLTTGLLQQEVYGQHREVGRRAVIVGAEHVSFSAALTLHHAGATVAAMITDLPRHQTYLAFRAGAMARFRFPVLTLSEIARVVGQQRVEAVEVRSHAGISTIPCDTVVFTGDWIPDNELARRGDILLDRGTRGPAVDAGFATSVPGVFAAGNLVHPVVTADLVALEGRYAAQAVARYLAGENGSGATVGVDVVSPLRWVAPNRLGPSGGMPQRGRLLAWSSAFVARPRIQVVQDGRMLESRRLRRIVPNRPFELRAGWIGSVDPGGGPVVVRILCNGVA